MTNQTAATSNPQKAKKGAKTASKADSWTLAASSTIKFHDKNVIEVDNEFGDLMKDPVAMNLIRQNLRAWFMAYVPVYESGYVVSTLENSIHYFEALDQFFSELVEAGINRQKGGQEHE